ncbi:hypothetical protein PVAP13_2KG276316 [Panicum virgatum]|uniref:Uncharacterized protein n=1 Tax=Panicum virgatum TaxID=38727 RepID=A0A8T0W4B2_PANVG|nr:hypothetical protein PVAP13_2KG276316 [Panicum virgatum]
MAHGGKGKKLLSLLEKKDVANTVRTAIRKEAEESNSMMARMEAMDNHELREYMLQNKGTLESQMKTTIKKLLRKDKPKKKRRTMLCPILGATLNFTRMMTWTQLLQEQ